MELTKHQIEQFRENGFLLIEDLFSPSEIDQITQEALTLQTEDSPDVVWEEDKKHVRALLGSHLKSDLYQKLIAQPRLVSPMKQLLASDCYVYQFKINTKMGFSGQIWPWHQDFIFWSELDGMEKPEAVNIAIFLDDCTEFNGSLWLIPGSHQHGSIIPSKNEKKGTDWQSDVSKDLTFQLTNADTEKLIDQHGLVAPKGKAGSALIFHPNLAHASPPNISPYKRRLMIITYNSVDNVPQPASGIGRPSFLVHPYTGALETAEVGL